MEQEYSALKTAGWAGKGQGSLADELLRALPARIFNIEGGLFFAGGQAFFFNQDERGQHHFKCLSSQSLRIAFTLENIDSGWLPPGIVRSGVNPHGQWFVKFVPPGKHNLVIQGEAGEKTTLEGLPLPGLIFGGCGNEYYVWATSETEFNPQGLCYAAPLSNLYDDGRVCYGDNQVPAASTEVAGSAWWLFINSPFNGHLSQGKSNRFPQDVRLMLQELQENKAERYPVEDLRPFRLAQEWTIEQAVEKYILKERVY